MLRVYIFLKTFPPGSALTRFVNVSTISFLLSFIIIFARQFQLFFFPCCVKEIKMFSVYIKYNVPHTPDFWSDRAQLLINAPRKAICRIGLGDWQCQRHFFGFFTAACSLIHCLTMHTKLYQRLEDVLVKNTWGWDQT